MRFIERARAAKLVTDAHNGALARPAVSIARFSARLRLWRIAL